MNRQLRNIIEIYGKDAVMKDMRDCHAIIVINMISDCINAPNYTVQDAKHLTDSVIAFSTNRTTLENINKKIDVYWRY